MLKKRIDQLLYASCGVVSALALFGIMWLTLVDVIGRKFFNHSIPGGLEITEIMLVCVIFCALPLVSWRGEHVVFDTFDGFIPKPLQRVQVRLVHVFSAFVFVGLAYLMTTKAMQPRTVAMALIMASRRRARLLRGGSLSSILGWIMANTRWWSRRRDLNPRPSHYECDALPLSYSGLNV